ncbi:hypothetical protein, partial [Rudanella lutea]|uniref:hypothetical protein n=1 Tax=Rudanella lutea TaxID=451374 RepID=UPI0005C6ABF4
MTTILRSVVAMLVGIIGLGLSAKAQQNLFNIPSGDITPEKKVFYQHQLNVYTKQIESKGHFVYGLGKGWDAGVNVVGKAAYFRPRWRLNHNDERRLGSVSPIVLATLQKQFKVSPRVAVNLGTQSGTNLFSHTTRREFAHFTYGLVKYELSPGRKVVAGPYVSNSAFAGAGNHTGLMLGYEWKLNDKWYLMGDWISGRNEQSVGVAGVMYWATKHVQFCAGAILPNPQTPKQNGIVFEINILGWDADH